jgi:hypothetical protein
MAVYLHLYHVLNAIIPELGLRRVDCKETLRFVIPHTVQIIFSDTEGVSRYVFPTSNQVNEVTKQISLYIFILRKIHVLRI